MLNKHCELENDTVCVHQYSANTIEHISTHIASGFVI